MYCNHRFLPNILRYKGDRYHLDIYLDYNRRGNTPQWVLGQVRNHTIHRKHYDPSLRYVDIQ